MASRARKIDPEKSLTSKPEVQPVTENLDENEIAARAYQLWRERGCPIGSDQEDWFKAESELKGRGASGRNVLLNDA
jgi:hypothetical protein